MRGTRHAGFVSFSGVMVAGMMVVTLIAFHAGVGLAQVADDNEMGGGIYAWGDNSAGQLGSGGATGSRLSPSHIEEPAAFKKGGITTITAGPSHAVALGADGTVWTWGSSQGADGGTPVKVKGLHGVRSLAAGGDTTFALDEPGVLRSWTRATNRPAVVAGLDPVKLFASSSTHHVALQADGKLKAWGDNRDGQLGDGTTENRSVPVTVPGVGAIAAIAAGELRFTALLRADGTVWTFGNNAHGQLGDGTTKKRSVAARVTGLTKVSAIAAGHAHMLALREDGTVWAWGDNSKRQLGDAATASRLTAAPVRGLKNIIGIAAGHHHSLAIGSDGSLWAWGDNSKGQLGDGTNQRHDAPFRVPNSRGVTAVTAGAAFSMAISDGRSRTSNL